jgi:hypothetical protein
MALLPTALTVITIIMLFRSSFHGFITYTHYTHCTGNSKHIFPEMKLHGLIPKFYIHIPGSDLYIPIMGLIWNLYFPVLHERLLGSTAGAKIRAGNFRLAGFGGAVTCLPHRSCG